VALGCFVPRRDGLCSVAAPWPWVVGFARLSSRAVLSESVSASGSFGAEELRRKRGFPWASFPLSLDTKVYAAMGNHDFHPKNQFPGKEHRIYERTAELWRPWLNDASVPLFRAGVALPAHVGSTLGRWGWLGEYHEWFSLRLCSEQQYL